MGDLVDKRRSISPLCLEHLLNDFLRPLAATKLPVYMIAGNHDTYYKTTNKINWLDNILNHRELKNFNWFIEATDIKINGETFLLIPWINSGNENNSFRVIEKSSARYAFGHLELAGFKFSKHVMAEHGYDSAILRNFDAVFTGHYHEPSSQDNIHYIGAPYEMTWADSGCERGFIILDTSTGEVKKINNPLRKFIEVNIDDVENIPNETFAQTYVKVFSSKSDIDLDEASNSSERDVQKIFRKFMEKIKTVSPLDIRFIENNKQNIDMSDENISLNIDDFQIFESTINNMDIKVDKKMLLSEMRMIFEEASRLR